MRLLVLLVLLAACGGGATPVASDASVGNCTLACPPCPGADQCLPGYNLSGCLLGCTTSTDCAENEVCALVDQYADGRAGIDLPVCVGKEVTTECHSASFDCGGHTDKKCLDDKRLATGFVWSHNFVCGYTLTTCDNGCSNGTCQGSGS
ncbi:MAG: hypothetical protein ABI321_16275 [Polyangia bacterium]